MRADGNILVLLVWHVYSPWINAIPINFGKWSVSLMILSCNEQILLWHIYLEYEKGCVLTWMAATPESSGGLMTLPVVFIRAKTDISCYFSLKIGDHYKDLDLWDFQFPLFYVRLECGEKRNLYIWTYLSLIKEIF